MTQEDYYTLPECRPTFRYRPEHDRFEAETKKIAKSKICDGFCDQHTGSTKAVRVAGPDGCDWGWFSYCEAARQENVKRGFLLYAETPTGIN